MEVGRATKIMRKRDFVIGSIAIYVILILIYSMHLVDRFRPDDCDYRCIRFCCFEQKSCSEKFIRDNLNDSLVPSFQPALEEKFRILYGRPHCKLKQMDSKEKWKFTPVRNINALMVIYLFADFQFSAIILGDEFYEENEYCLQDKKIDEKTVSWVLNVCETNESIGAKIHIGRKSKFVQAEAED